MGVGKKSFSSMGRHRTCKNHHCSVSHFLTLRRQEKYIPPKKPYSFEAMLEDLLEFATVMLVDNGRLSLWMPTANDEDVLLGIPTHPCLELVSVCVQTFNKCASPNANTAYFADVLC